MIMTMTMMMMMLLFISCTAESCSIQLYLILIILFILELIASSFHLLDILRTYHQFLHRLHQKWTFHLDVCRWIYLFYFSVEISLYVLLSFHRISILNSYYLFMPLHRKIIFLLPTRMDIPWGRDFVLFTSGSWMSWTLPSTQEPLSG